MQIIDAEAHVMGALIREEILPDKAWTYPYNPPRPNNLAREVRAQLMDPSQNKLFVEDLIATMDEHGVERAVVQPGASTLTNDEVVQVLAQYPDRFIGFGRWDHFDPRPGKRGSGGMLEAADAMERGIRDLGLRGIGEVALGFWYPIPTDEVHVHVRPMMEVAAAYDVPVAFHTGGMPMASRSGMNSPFSWMTLRWSIRRCRSSSTTWAARTACSSIRR